MKVGEFFCKNKSKYFLIFRILYQSFENQYVNY